MAYLQHREKKLAELLGVAVSAGAANRVVADDDLPSRRRRPQRRLQILRAPQTPRVQSKKM